MTYSSSEVQVQPDQENECNDKRRDTVCNRHDRHGEADQLCERVLHDVLDVHVDAIDICKT